MPLSKQRALAEIFRQAFLAPAVGEHAGGEMRAGRMRRDVEAIRIAAEASRIAEAPGQRAAHLLVHRHQVAAGLLDIDEVDDHRVNAGAHQHFRLQRVIGRLVAAPGAAVNEDIDRRIRRRGAEDVEPLVFARPVGDALRRSDDSAGAFARGDAARDDQRPVRRIDVLVVGVVERLLVHVAPDQRSARG